MNKHKYALSNTTLKRINRSKYNKIKDIELTHSIKDEYEIREDGWRKKKNERD